MNPTQRTATAGLRLIAYVRVSATAGRDPETETSAPDQRRAIEAHALARGYEIADWIEDFDESGGKWERPGFQRALEMVERGEVDGLIVAKLDRFSRSLIDALRGIDVIERAGGEFVSVADAFDTTTPMGKAMMQISAVFAELERARIRENWATQRADAIERGVQVGRAPIGYLRREDGTLEADAVAAPVIREVFRRRAAGASWGALADLLDERLPKPGGGAWSRQTIAALLRRRTYLGEVRNGNSVHRDAHEALVSRAEFEAAQSDQRGIGRKTGSLLAGLARCAGCSYSLTRSTDRTGHAVYRCRKRHTGGRCPAPVSIGLDSLDEYVTGQFLDWARRQRLVALGARRGSGEAAREIAARLEDAEAELAEYRDDRETIRIIGRDAWNAGLRVRQREVDDARRTLAQTETGGSGDDLALDVEQLWGRSDLAGRRALLASYVGAAYVRRADAPGGATPISDRVRLVEVDDLPDDLPGRGGGPARRFAFDAA